MALCFVLMPFGRKKDASGVEINFDAVYESIIKPGIIDAGMEPLRADEERAGGIIHKAMIERLVLCEFAVADLTSANANVFYELGIRHGVRPYTTVAMFAKSSPLPFDVTYLRCIPYELANGAPSDAAQARRALAEALRNALERENDSPVYTFIDDLRPPVDSLAHEKTDLFRSAVRYAEEKKRQLAAARKANAAAVHKIEAELGDLRQVEAGIAIDLFLSYRDVSDWDAMIAVVDKLARPVAQSTLVREQLALALNRAGRGDEAEQRLNDLIDEKGPTPENCGLLGRVHKDRWKKARAANDPAAPGLLRKALDAYLRGFEADWRDAYPGINVLTMMECADPPDPRQAGLLPLVSYAVERKIARGKPDYWDYATRIELGVLERNQAKAELALTDALACVKFKWEAETTTENLQTIRICRKERGDVVLWADKVEETLRARFQAPKQ